MTNHLLRTESKIYRNPEMLSSDMDGEKVMMSIENGEYYGLNPIGSRIWELIEQPKTIDKLISILTDEFDVTPEICENDVLAFLKELLEKNLIITDD